MNDSYEIVIYCDSGSNKHGKKHPTPVVQGFLYRSSMSDQMGLGWTDVSSSKRLRASGATVDAARAMVGNVPYSRSEHLGQEHRESWNLRCLKCGESVPVRHEKLYPALSRMMNLGLNRMGLRAMADGLESTS